MTTTQRSLAALWSLVGVLAGALGAQDMLVLDNAGAVFSLDSQTLAVQPVGPGRSGLRGLATDGRTLWSNGGNRLVTIDPQTGIATDVASTFDYAGLTWDPSSATLYGVRFQIGSNQTSVVDRIDPQTGQANRVASWWFPSGTHASAIAAFQGSLLAWDTFAGLILVDIVTGTGTPVGPGSGPIVFLCTHPDGRLLGGAATSSFFSTTNLVQVDPVSGVRQLIGHVPTQGYLVGGTALVNPRQSIGVACAD